MILSTPIWAAIFLVATCVSLAASNVLVRRLEGFAARLGLSEAILGLISALAANSPEMTSAITALATGEHDIGIGVVLGSNVFNLAALLGLGALVAGSIDLRRAAVVLTGSVGAWAVLGALTVVGGDLPPVFGLLVVLVVVIPYVAIAAAPQLLHSLLLPTGWSAVVRRALFEEEIELAEAIRRRRGRGRDAALAATMLVTVIGASVVMERSASLLGSRFQLATIVVGGLVLAAVTSLPNAVAAIYLARRGRGAAVLSEAMNSNMLNVVVGFLLPASMIGLANASAGGGLIAAAFAAGLTLCALALAYRGHGLRRWSGGLLVVGYLAFAAVLIAR